LQAFLSNIKNLRSQTLNSLIQTNLHGPNRAYLNAEPAGGAFLQIDGDWNQAGVGVDLPSRLDAAFDAGIDATAAAFAVGREQKRLRLLRL